MFHLFIPVHPFKTQSARLLDCIVLRVQRQPQLPLALQPPVLQRCSMPLLRLSLCRSPYPEYDSPGKIEDVFPSDLALPATLVAGGTPLSDLAVGSSHPLASDRPYTMLRPLRRPPCALPTPPLRRLPQTYEPGKYTVFPSAAPLPLPLLSDRSPATPDPSRNTNLSLGALPAVSTISTPPPSTRYAPSPQHPPTYRCPVLRS